MRHIDLSVELSGTILANYLACTTARDEAPNLVNNPFKALVGKKIKIPAGAEVTNFKPSVYEPYITDRTRTVTLHQAGIGYSDYDHWRLPTVKWAGAGGYWQETPVTDEMLILNGITE